MDAKILGKNIYCLRKSKNMTQTQLAEALNISDKAVSKWEIGNGFPDLQQIEALTAFFKVTFDELLGEKVIDTTTIGATSADVVTEKVEVAPMISLNCNINEWYKLDNAAKVYPPQAGKEYNAVFRIAAILKEKVNKELLQQALEESYQRFPSMMVTLKKGAFWYYLEPVNKKPLLEIENKYPSRFMPLDGKNFLFRVTYSDFRVGVECFHSITDGTGASIFLNSILTRYYELKKNIKVTDFKNALCLQDNPTETELDDSFNRFAERKNYAKRKISSAYHLSGKHLKPTTNIVTHVIMDAKEVNAYAKTFGATITEFLGTAIIESIYKRQKFEKEVKRHISMQVPINLRKFFPSETLRNFSFFANVDIHTEKKEYTFEEILEEFKIQLKKGADIKYLQENINANVKEEKNPIIKIVPLALKNIGLVIASTLIGDSSTTVGFSNLGNLQTPDELKTIIDRYEFVLKEPKNGGHACSCISFNNKLVVSFIRSIKDSYLEKEFVRTLTSRGLTVAVETNI